MEDDSQELPADENEVEEESQEDPTETDAQAADQSESAPDGGEAPKETKVEFTPEQQEVFDSVIAKKTFKQREAERKAQDLERQVQELQAKLPKSGRPEVPPPPDPYDADYEDKLRQRDEALTAAAAYDAQEDAVKRQQEAAYRQRQEAEQEELVKSAQSYKERADKIGLDPTELQNAGNALAQFGIPDDLTRFILKDEQGPLMTTYLARNPTVLEEMQGMSALEMGAYIASTVKPQLATARTRTKAPDPADVLDGGGSPPVERGPKGATFE